MPVGLSVLDIETDVINPLNTNTVDINGAKIKLDFSLGSVHIGNTDMSPIPSGSVIIGSQAALNLIGNNNVAIGHYAMLNSNISTNNVCVGTSAGGSIVDTVGNTLIGDISGGNITSGVGNTSVGNSAGLSVTTGNQNVFIGDNSGAALPSITGNNVICIGKESNPTNGTVSNQITLGNSAITTLRCAVTSITSLSDERDKDEIKDLSAGLDFINEIKPVSFVWKDRDEEGKQGIKDSGFTAQNLKEVQEKYNLSEELKLVYDENPEKLEASYGRLIPILVKAIQELSDKFKELEAK